MINTLTLSPGDKIGLGELLSLHGSIIQQDHGCWVKIEAQLCIKQTIERPHGIRYSLSLHTPSGDRILGYDNAHPVKKKQGRFAVTRTTSYDHKHKNANDTGEPYHFTNAQQLMTDFWGDVDVTLKKYRETLN